MLYNIPIYRAKKINSDEYVEGFLTRSRCYSGVYILPSNYNQDENIEGYEEEIIEIDPTTIAIHHPNMLASDSDRYFSNSEKDLRIFASLQEDGKGGDLVDCYLGKNQNIPTRERQIVKYYKPFYIGFRSYDIDAYSKLVLIGIQQ